MGDGTTQAETALKSGNYKDAYTKCVMTLLAGSTVPASFLCLSPFKKKQKSAACLTDLF